MRLFHLKTVDGKSILDEDFHLQKVDRIFYLQTVNDKFQSIGR